MFHARRPRRWTAIAVLIVASVTACAGSGPGGDAEVDETGDPDAVVARVVPASGVSDADEVPDPESSDPESSDPESSDPESSDPESIVVAADLITTGGDLDRALADGVVTEGDVAAARAGLADGTLADLFD